MKSLKPIFGLFALFAPGFLYADGLKDYRAGAFKQADEALLKNDATSNPLTQYYLARMNLYGYGTLRQQKLALSYFKNAALKGHLESALFLGSYSLLVDKNPKEALVWFKKAAEKGEVNAQMYCAAAYQFGLGTPILPDTAKRYIIDAAKNGNAIAQYTLAMDFLNSKHAENKKLGLIWLSKSANAKFLPAMSQMGELLVLGQGVAIDAVKGQAYLKQAIDKAYGPAFYSMGKIALNQKDFNAAKDWFEKATQHQVTDGYVALSELYERSEVPFHNEKESYLYLLKAAQDNNKTAQWKLSKLYSEGKRVTKDDTLSKEWARLARQTQRPGHAKAHALAWLFQKSNASFETSVYALKGILSPWSNKQALQQGIYNPAPQKSTLQKETLFKPHFEKINPNEIALNEYFDLLVKLSGDTNPNDWKFPIYGLEKPVLLLKEASGDQTVQEDPSLRYNMYMTEEESKALNPTAAEIKKDIFTRAQLGDSNAAFMAGQIYQQGIGVKKNLQKAISYYEIASTFQDAKAKYVLGLIYINEEAGMADIQKGLALLADAAFKGDAYAQYTMARIYENGFGKDGDPFKIVKSKEQSDAFYALAASSNYAKAQFRLAEKLSREATSDETLEEKARRTALVKRLYEHALENGETRAAIPVAFFDAMEDGSPQKQQKAFEVAQKAAEENDPQAAILLGLLYDRGIGTSKDSEEAREWFERNANHPISEFVLGTYEAFDDPSDEERNEARVRLNKAASAGFSYAYLNLGVLNQQMHQPFIVPLETAFKMGNLKAGMMMADYVVATEQDMHALEQAREIFKKVAEKGDKVGHLKYGFMLDKGLGGPMNTPQAQIQYQMAAEQHQPQAEFLLAQLYDLGGVGGLPDDKLAKKWYSASADTYTPSAVALGYYYEVVEDNLAKATVAYQKAAEANDLNGQYNLALVYELGKGQRVDYEKARDLYIKAAQKKHAKAMTQLAGLYLKGAGVEQSIDTAISWYEKAGLLGDENALYQLGVIYEAGLNSEANNTKARDYYLKAAALGQQRAIFALARMYQMGIGGDVNLALAQEQYQILADLNNPKAQYQLALLLLKAPTPPLKEIQRLLMQASTNGSVSATQYLQKEKALIRDSFVSYIASLEQSARGGVSQKNPNLMYFQAVNLSNQGDIERYRILLTQIVEKYPEFMPAKEAYEKLKSQSMSEAKLSMH